MDFLIEIPAATTPAVKRSPFWRKTYAGFAPKQLEFFERNLRDVRGMRICDPMSGQAFSLCQMAWSGADVWISDINAGALALASLRDPRLLRNARALTQDVANTLRKLKRPRKRVLKRDESVNWLSPTVEKQIQEIADTFGLDPNHSPLGVGSIFWEESAGKRLILGLLVLAARSLASYRSSDNTTWNKAGGITPGLAVVDAIGEALHSWQDYASNARAALDRPGRVQIKTWNCENGPLEAIERRMDAVVVSPPYANRIDYAQLWAPELAVVTSAFRQPIPLLKAAQTGTTCVKGKWPADKSVAALPKAVREALQAIRSDNAKASERYYYPFFANYATSLKTCAEAWCAMVRKNGKLLIIIRDTVRKDHIFPSDVVVRETAKLLGFRQTNPDEQPLIIRHHIGLLRHRRAKASVHGLAQREWMLAFQRD